MMAINLSVFIRVERCETRMTRLVQSSHAPLCLLLWNVPPSLS